VPTKQGKVKREVVAGLIGAEAGAGVGLLIFGGLPLVPLAMTAAGAGAGALAVVAMRRMRVLAIRRELRSQLRAAR
jgi:uncharacterized membrane protein